MTEVTRILLVEDNPGDALLLDEMLRSGDSPKFVIQRVERLDDALQQLTAESFDLVFVDLSLPDSHGLETFVKLHHDFPDVAIVVLTGLDDEMTALQAVGQGAQDYLVKGHSERRRLVQAAHYAVERHHMLQELKALSLIDELTGLHNRRGFEILGKKQLEIAGRSQKGIALIFADLDGLKKINDTLGHRCGDLALMDTADVLKRTFRNADILARIGGDEFACLAVEMVPDRLQMILSRLEQHLSRQRARTQRPFELSLSIGVACYDAENPCDIDALIERADAEMYKNKKEKRSSK
ncbi:GGDEF domain-containing response regulator [bacterium]|nr:GGDEF domain-containing response regulator [bacterium]